MKLTRARRQGGIALRSLLLAASASAGSSEDLRASDPQSPTSADPVARSEPSRDDGRRTLRRLPANLGRGFVGVFARESLGPFVLGAAATAGASLLDDTVRDSVADPDSGFGQRLEWPGKLPATTIPVIAVFTAGRFVHDARFRAMSYDLGEAAAVTFAFTGPLKAAVSRERPDGSDNHSFPSGHASHAFAIATVTERHYGWKLGVPMYAVATVVGYTRLVQDEHYLSDVVAGATIGFIVGRTVVRLNDRPLGPPGGRARATWRLTPLVSRDVRGLQLAVSY